MTVDPLCEAREELTRRHFLGGASLSVCSLALGSLLGREVWGQGAGAPRHHFAPRAKRILYLHMAGGPSHIDLFDAKPKLADLHGQVVPKEVIHNERFAFIKGDPKFLASPYSFAKHGESALELSELLPNLAGIADRLCLVRSLHTEEFNHAPAQIFLNTGHARIGRPSLGSWLSYGLGSDNQDLPAFVVLLSGQFAPSGGSSCWGSGFLPGVHQGVRFRSQGDAVLFLSDPDGMTRDDRRRSLETLAKLNEIHHGDTGDPEIRTRIAQYEMAYRMQASVPELLDIDSEPASVREMYGIEPGKVSFANNCLLARRLAERGVRFIQLYHWGWDSHGTGEGDDIVHSLPKRCRETDRATTALILDLEQRGLLEDTLVIWGGEFGRTPMNEERDGSKFLGRDHHPHAFGMFLAGGGVRAGTTVGATDEFGYRINEEPISVHDLNATILHLMGLDHLKLTYRFQGRDFRLTDVYGEVKDCLLA